MVSRNLRPISLGRLRFAAVEDVSAVMPLITESMSENFRIRESDELAYLMNAERHQVEINKHRSAAPWKCEKTKPLSQLNQEIWTVYIAFHLQRISKPVDYRGETCILSICQLDINETVVGFMALKDFPTVPSVNPGAWEDFVWTKFKAIELNARNTLFVHMLCWNNLYGREVVDSLLKSVFMHDPYLQFIGMMKSSIKHQLLIPGQSRSESSFKRLQAAERGVPGDLLPALWVAERREVSPGLRIRRAVEEDNDDIVPIIERHSVRLRQLYGDFYISELISRHPESERVLLVCEHKELAVGVMCLNTQINYEALEESFELSPFTGLRHMDKPVQREHDSIISSHYGGNVESGLPSKLDLLHPKGATKSRVTWSYEEDAFKHIHKESDRTRTHQVPFSQLDVLQLLEEDEELDYDIVNITTDLLHLPRLFTEDDFWKKRDRRHSVEEMRDQKESAYDNKYLMKDDQKPSCPSVSLNVGGLSQKVPEPSRYSGVPNAFLLELFAMHPDYDERYGFDMLEVAFELFPGRDYCVMCLPSSHTCFPLLEHFTLVTPYSFRMRFINETLYVAHVNSIRGEVRVRPAEAYDIPHLNAVLEHAPRKYDIGSLFETTLTSVSLSSFVFLSQNQPIGLIILGPLKDVTSIRTQYDLDAEAKMSGTDGSILACVMSPIMEPHGRWYLRDVLRQTRYTTLFWVCRLFAKGDASPTRNLMSLANQMVPMRPRRFIPNIGHKSSDKTVKDIATPFALWTLERPLTSLPKVHVNNSIVIVGASRTGLAFLETLLMGPTSEYLTFTNITLVSQHGLPTVTECMRAAEVCVPRDGRYTDRYLKSVPFYYYVDIMSATVVRICRKKKCIYLSGGGVKYYDELVLTCGQQFQHPEYLKESIELAKEIEKGKPCVRMLMDNPLYAPDGVPVTLRLPENVMLINSLYEANACLRKLMRMIMDETHTKSLSEDNTVVVYGDCIEAYSCVAALLEMGLSAENITFVEPFPPVDATAMRVNCFNHETVDERVQASIQNLGVRIYRKWYFHGWSLRDDRVEFIRLMSPLHAMHLPCFALFYYGIKAIDLNAFKAINESGLVYDGGLVVGPLFETNDPYVFGAGPCVKYSRRLYAPQHSHKYYCSEDVGEALAQLFLQKLDPFLREDVDGDLLSSEAMRHYSSSLTAQSKGSHGSMSSTALRSLGIPKSRWQPVLKFSSPLVYSATLPGPLYYMQIRKPGRDVPIAVRMLLPNQGHTLVTDKKQNYFRLQLNSLHCIEAVTCLSRKQFSCDTLAQLYGKHEAYFNNLLVRFTINLIDDFYDYFTRPWIAALYQEPFSNLLYDIYEQGGNTTYDVVKSKYDELFTELRTEVSVDRLSGSACIWMAHARHVHGTGCSDCGQNDEIRHEAETFWKAVGGESLVYKHLARYLHANVLTNPQYAIPEKDVI